MLQKNGTCIYNCSIAAGAGVCSGSSIIISLIGLLSVGIFVMSWGN